MTEIACSDIYKKILIATDGSENSKKAVESGVELASCTGAETHAVYVVSTHSRIGGIPQRGADWIKNVRFDLEEEGKKALEDVKKVGEERGVDVKTAILDGHPSDEIINFAEKNGVDLIIVGTLGKTGINRFLLGSVAQNVVTHAKGKVLVVRD
ncbi:MAG: universal stress protein [Methanohalobium sp.]|uniref:universal stress protein n=1 Tax=Methanohalobium sp. TaxID=2837493 RepID=UPI00397C0086